MKNLSMLVLLAVLLPGLAMAQNVENGKRVFVRDGCYECHGYAARGRSPGRGLAPPVLNAAGHDPLYSQARGGDAGVHR